MINRCVVKEKEEPEERVLYRFATVHGEEQSKLYAAPARRNRRYFYNSFVLPYTTYSVRLARLGLCDSTRQVRPRRPGSECRLATAEWVNRTQMATRLLQSSTLRHGAAGSVHNVVCEPSSCGRRRVYFEYYNASCTCMFRHRIRYACKSSSVWFIRDETFHATDYCDDTTLSSDDRPHEAFSVGFFLFFLFPQLLPSSWLFRSHAVDENLPTTRRARNDGVRSSIIINLSESRGHHRRRVGEQIILKHHFSCVPRLLGWRECETFFRVVYRVRGDEWRKSWKIQTVDNASRRIFTLPYRLEGDFFLFSPTWRLRVHAPHAHCELIIISITTDDYTDTNWKYYCNTAIYIPIDIIIEWMLR